MNTARELWDQAGPDYLTAKDEAAVEVIFPVFTRHIGDLAGKVIVDYGCGDGRYARLLKSLGAGQAIGVDVSPTMIAAAVAADHAYDSDGFTAYADLVYGPARYTALPDKSQTYTVEGGNAALRHFLARLGRKSRCFSRCLTALRRAVRLFIWCYNQRQLWNQRYPAYRRHVSDFVPPSC